MKVLIKFFENTKVTDINNFPELHEEIQGIFQLESNTYFLQKFDREFNEFVDIENEQDLVDKDKIKVVLRHPQVIPISEEDFTQSLTVSSQPIYEVPETQEIVALPLHMKQWPAQLVLPVENFSSLLREALNAKKFLSWDMSRELVGHLANYAYSFKPYPNKAERLEVCQALIEIYPYLRNESGIGIHGLEIKLLNKIKKIRQKDTSLEVQLNRLNSKIDGSYPINEVPETQEIVTLPLCMKQRPAQLVLPVPETQEIVALPLRMKQWPAQLVLPVENFSSLLREDLNAKKFLSWEMSRELVGHLANYAYSFKPYPNKAERLEVCQALIDIYPYLKNEIGIGIHAWELKLLNKLKKIRQGDTSLEVQLNRLNSKIDGSTVPKNASINPKKGELNWAPDHVPGENGKSVALHKTNLKNEAAKSENHQDKSKINSLMSLTYSFRRQDINNKIQVKILKEEYPLFFQRNQQLEEFERLTAVAIKEVFFQESKNQGQILYKLFRKKKKTVEETLLLTNFIAECEDLEPIKVIEAEISFGFFLLPYLLKDDAECLIKIVPDGDSIPEYGVSAEAYPKIYATGSLLEGSYSIICEDVELTICKDFLNSVCLLISYYYTLNIQFPAEANNTLAFLQFSVLKIHSGRMPPRVKTLMSKVKLIQEDCYL